MSEPAIRFYDPADAQDLFEASAESIPEIHPWLPWCHPGYALAEAQAYIAHTAQARAAAAEFSFAVFDGAGRFAGGVGLSRIDRPNRTANLGYWVRSDHCRQGVATAAVLLLRDWGFANTGLVRMEIVVAVENRASLRVAEKSGAVREGVLSDRLLLHDGLHDAAVFSFTRPRQHPHR